MTINADEATKIQNFLRKKLDNSNIALKPRADDVSEESAEVHLNGEFIGVVFKDSYDGETAYHFQWTIIEEDLDES